MLEELLRLLTVQAMAVVELGGLSVFAGQDVGDTAPAGQ